MQIKDDFLEDPKVDHQKSPNHSGIFTGGQPDMIVIHYTAGSTAKSAVRTLCNPATKASAHLVVGADGHITQLVPFNAIAWHAGRSSYMGRSGLNKYAIGVEIVNAGRLTKGPGGFTSWFGATYPDKDVIEAVHRNETTLSFWHRYEEIQINKVLELCYLLAETYPIQAIVGHEEISPGRKSDPGPGFPLENLRDLVLKKDRSEEGQADEWSTQMMGVVTASELNIRTSPRLSATKAANPLLKGTVVDILTESSGWYEVDVTTRGWVKNDYIRT